MSHRASAVPLAEQGRRTALSVLQGIDRIVECGVATEDGLSYDGTTLRLDDGGTGHAGLVVTLPPHDTGPFADRLREHRVHLFHPELLAAITAMDIRSAVRAISLEVRLAVIAASSLHGGQHHHKAEQGARYALMLACEASLAGAGRKGHATVEHPWGDVPGRESCIHPWSPLRVELPALMQVVVSWDAVDVDVTVEGVRHDAAFEASTDPVAALRLRKELDALLPRAGMEEHP